MADFDVREFISNFNSNERFCGSSHFSARVYGNEPILTTGRQMSSYLPDRYREMRAISRWQEGTDGRRGRWLTEEELFWRQGTFMADFEDDCPYRGTFKSYFPTYNAMSDHQLRGYFSWRARVRAGTVEETSQSFAFVYLYELLCGIGVENPQDGFEKIRAFWQAYRAYVPEIDRYVRTWLQDYVVYHGLPAELLQQSETCGHDLALARLQRAQDAAVATERVARALRGQEARGGKRSPSVLVPPVPELEDALYRGIVDLSSYRLDKSRFAKEHYEDVRHVACAVYLRLVEHYDKHRKLGLFETLFGANMELPYAMFASAVFFDPNRHEDCTYRLDDSRTYICRSGLWTCKAYHGAHGRSSKLGEIMRDIDRMMREAWDYPHALKESHAPKYVEQMIAREIEERLAWNEAHRRVTVDIDLSRLGDIRSAAAQTREALLIDEEREEPGATCGGIAPAAAAAKATPATGSASAPVRAAAPEVAVGPATGPESERGVAKASGLPAAAPAAATAPASAASSAQASDANAALSHEQAAFLRALRDDDPTARAQALGSASASEDMMVDAINEAFFDLVGDTVIEYGADGPELIEDYREDVEEILGR